MKRVGLLILLAVAGCSDAGSGGSAPTQTSQDLESAAIARGVIRDPDDADPEGLYDRDTDRVCLVASRSAYRIGAFVDYGEGITCSASGRATRDGETLHIEFGKGCAFDARFDGQRVIFPGDVPDDCASLCRGRAALSGLEVARLSASVSEARALRDASGRLLCDIDERRRVD